MDIKEIIKEIGNVDFEITYRCNLNCLHCYNPESLKKPELSTSDIKNIISQVKEVGFEEIHITGGEPCLHKDILEILSFANSLDLRILLETNATVLPDVGYLKNLKNLTIRASIEGPEKIHNKIRVSKIVSNVFEKSISNLVVAKNAGIPVQITMSVNKLNYTSLVSMVDSLVLKGLDNIRLRLSMPASHAFLNWEELKLSKEDYTILQNEVDLIVKKYPSINFVSQTFNRKKPSISPKFFIDPYGEVKSYPFIEHYIGNVLTTSLSELLLKVPLTKYPKDEEDKMINYLVEIIPGD